MKPNPIIPPTRPVKVKRGPRITKGATVVLGDAIEAYYAYLLRCGYSTHEAATSTLAFVKCFLKDRLP